jgi:hypothetical protein
MVVSKSGEGCIEDVICGDGKRSERKAQSFPDCKMHILCVACTSHFFPTVPWWGNSAMSILKIA